MTFFVSVSMRGIYVSLVMHMVRVQRTAFHVISQLRQLLSFLCTDLTPFRDLINKRSHDNMFLSEVFT